MIFSIEQLEYLYKSYKKENLAFSIEAFHEDIKRFVQVDKILRRKIRGDDIPLRLLINHIIILRNTFGIDAYGILSISLSDDTRKLFLSIIKYMNSTFNGEYDIEFYKEIKKELG